MALPLGRIGLATAGDLAVPEVAGLDHALLADLLEVSAGDPSPLKVEIDPRLYVVGDPPTWSADLFPHLAAKLGQFWVVRGDRQGEGRSTAAGIFCPEPVVHAPGTRINQQQLIDGQRSDLYLPLVLDPQNRCFQAWKRSGHGVVPCR